MDITGKVFKIGPLTLTGNIRFREWVIAETMARVRRRIDAYGDLLGQHERRRVMDDAMASIDSGEAQRDLASTPEGRRYLVWLHLVESNPDITLDQAGCLFSALGGSMDAIDAKLAEANGLLQESADDQAQTEIAEPAKPEKPEMTPDQKRKAVFDSICKTADLSPDDLVDLPIAAAEALYFQAAKATSVDRLKLKAAIIEYAERQRNGQ